MDFPSTARRRVSIFLIALATALFFIPGIPTASGVEYIEVNCPGNSLQAAIDAAPPGGYLVVSGTCVENVVIDKDLHIGGDSWGHLDGGGSGPVVRVLADARVAITEMNIDNGVAEFGGGIHNEGYLNLDSVGIGNNRAAIAGGAIRNDGELRIWDSYIDLNAVSDGGGDGGGGALFNLGTADIGFSWLNDNAAANDRGGAIFNLGQLSVWGYVEFERNRAKLGGAIANGRTGHDAPVSLSLSDVYMGGNEAQKGGAIRVEAESDLVASSVYIGDNQAVEGGGISADGAAIELTDSDVADNVAAIGGGGIALRNGASLAGHSVVIDNNTAAANGGGLLVKNSTVDLVDSEITNNTGNDGGGFANAAGSSTTLVGTAVSLNTASHYGGGVFNAGSDIWITQSTVSDNTAAGRGGGVTNLRGGPWNGRVFVTNSTVARNDAPQGSAINNDDAFVALDHVTVTENTGSPAFYEAKSPPSAAPINSILAGNPGGDCDFFIDSGKGNVFGDCFAAGEDSPRPTDVSGVVDPQLTAVVDPGGFVVRYEPLPGSPAVNRVPVGNCTRAVDQLGTARPMGAGCDSGSIEVPEVIIEMSIDADFEFGHVFTARDLMITGQAQDDSGIRKVLVGIKDRGSGLWLQDDKTTWGSFNQMPAGLSIPGGPSTAWMLNVFLSNGDYSLAARAFDYDGNHVDIVPYRHFVVAADVTAPQVDADFAPLTKFASPVLLTGTATDDTAVAAVRLAIRDRVTKLWLQDDRVSWGPDYYGFYAGGEGWSTPEVTWSFEIELEVGNYNLSAMARDDVGNWGQMSPYRAFDVIVD